MEIIHEIMRLSPGLGQKMDVVSQIDKEKLLDTEFDYYFLLKTGDEYDVYLNLYAFPLSEEDVDYGSRVFQIETAWFIKKDNLLVREGSNEGFNDAQPLSEYPSYSSDHFLNRGVLIQDAAYVKRDYPPFYFDDLEDFRDCMPSEHLAQIT